jgi:hypothetical protein
MFSSNGLGKNFCVFLEGDKLVIGPKIYVSRILTVRVV